MAERDVPFYTQTAVLDTYIGADASLLEPETVELIAKTLRAKPEFYAYFFRRRPHYSWARELLKRGYFETAPELVKTERGTVAPRWEEQEYLISVAEDVPEIAVEHASRIKGNGYYFEGAVRAVKALPVASIEEIVPLIAGWLDDGDIAPYISLETFSLVKVIAEGGSDSAFLLFRKVTVPKPSGDTRTVEGFPFNSRAIALFPFDDYDERTLESATAVLQKLDPSQTITILETQLCEALRIEAEATADATYKIHSFWRVAIEDSDQDVLGHYKDKLLGVLRDTLETAARDGSLNLTDLIEKYLADDHVILRRLGFYLLSLFPEKYKEAVVREILRLENLEDVEIHHEFFALLKNGFAQLGTTEREQVANAIVIGPSQDKLDWLYEREEDETEERRQEYISRYSQSWIRDRLWMLKDSLAGEHQEILNRLTVELGKPERPDFTHWTSGAYFVADVSPVTIADLKLKSNEELLDYLRKWQPARENFGPERESHGALGQEAANLILSDVERYQPVALEIAAIHSAFAVALIDAPVPEGGDFDSITELRFTVCENLLRIEPVRKSLREATDGHWVGFRSVTVSMIKKLLADGAQKLSEARRLRVRDLLVILADDPDPDIASDRPAEGWFGNKDPMTVAINHVRSEAISALITYAVKMAVENAENKDANAVREMEPVVKEVLTTKVKRANDFSLAVHSVFGTRLINLFWLDRKWVEENLDEIFPVADDEESIAFYVAAWDAYAVFSHLIYQELFALLRSRYERAIENISKGYLTKTHLRPVNGLAQHLLLEYELNKYQINSPEGQQSLLAKFFNKALPEHRGAAAWELNKRTHQNKANWQSAKELWLWRLETAANAGHDSGFKAEMEAFSQMLSAAPETENIKTMWSLLEGFLPYLEDSEHRSLIWRNVQKYLAGEIERNPVEAIKFYSLMHDRLTGPRFYYEEEANKIIRLGSTDQRSKEATLSLADKLYRRGSYQFQDIIEGALGASKT